MTMLSASLPPDFFTRASFTTLAGTTGIVLVICGTIQSIFNFNPKWLALLVSLIVSFAGAAIAEDNADGSWKYIIALLNGFLIYSSATGANQVIGKNDPTTPGGPKPAAGGHQLTPAPSAKRTFLTRWWQ